MYIYTNIISDVATWNWEKDEKIYIYIVSFYLCSVLCEGEVAHAHPADSTMEVTVELRQVSARLGCLRHKPDHEQRRMRNRNSRVKYQIRC